MSRAWFWTKFSVLMIFSLWVGLVALPNNVKEMLPAPLAEKVSEYQLKLGIDLSGGTQLEYEVDFSEAEKRAAQSLLDKDSQNDIILDKRQIASGVVKTLKKRIDPDGTKEVNIFASQRGEKWFVIVELTSAIDTPDNRKKLEKVTSLQFKEPKTVNGAEKAENSLTELKKAETFSATQEKTQELGLLPVKMPTLSKDEISEYFGAENAEKIWNTPANTLFPEVVTGVDGNVGRVILLVRNKQMEDNPVLNEAGEQEVEKVERIQLDAIRFNDGREWMDTGLGGAQFRVAKTTKSNTGAPAVSITFDAEGGELFGDITGRLSKVSIPGLCGGTGQQFAIFVDGKSVSDPCVHERIDGGSAIITFGSVTKYNTTAMQTKEAQELAENLNSGATPAPVALISERKISASLGETAFEMSINAALIGFGLVALWMLFFFRFYGFLAIVALAFYAAVLIAILKSASFLVLTLSGIAGIILSIGMAVDANILIFERIKEELKDGQKYSDAVEEGFDRAWTSIKDSNVSSLITCFILWGLGTSIIKAFAITLAIGILISMFTAITFTWYLAKVFVPKFLEKKHGLLIGGK